MQIDSIKKNSYSTPAIDFIRHIRRPRESAQLWKDYIAFSNSVQFIREHAFIASRKKKILLIGSMTEFIYQVKTEIMLATGLRLRGWHPVVLASRLHPWSHRYFKASGITDFVYLEDFNLEKCDIEKSELDAREFLSTDFTFTQVKSWTTSGIWIGPQILSAISRSNYLGAPDVTDPSIRSQINKLLPKTLLTVARVRKLLNTHSPNLVLVNEPNGPIMGPLTDLSVVNGIDVISFCQNLRDDGLILKRLNAITRRIHPTSLAPETLAKIDQNLKWSEKHEKELDREFEARYGGKYFIQSRNQPGVGHVSQRGLIEKLSLDPSKKIATIFSHILWDANLFFGEDLFLDYGDWFIETLRAAIANPKVNWLVKLHPANVWKRARERVEGELAEVALIKEKIGKLPEHIKLIPPDTKMSTLSFFQSIDYGVTVRGTVGFELPCFGARTFTAGTGRYSGLGFTEDSESKEQYLNKLARIQEFGPLGASEKALARKHAYGVFCKRPWIMKSFEASFMKQEKGGNPLDHNLFTRARSVKEIQALGDLDHWAQWAEGKETDYLCESIT